MIDCDERPGRPPDRKYQLLTLSTMIGELKSGRHQHARDHP
jgi:hypothetical protein